MISDKTWTLTEVCERLSISEGTLRNWVRNGLLHPIPGNAEKRGNEDAKGRTGNSGNHGMEDAKGKTGRFRHYGVEDTKGGARGYQLTRDSRFLAQDVETLAARLANGEEGRLSGRRNKSFASGHRKSKNYLPKNSPNYTVVSDLLNLLYEILEKEGDFQKEEILYLCAGQLFQSCRRPVPEILQEWFREASESGREASEENRPAGTMEPAMAEISGAREITDGREITGDKEISATFSREVSRLRYVPGEDTLGNLYMSLRGMQERKQSGAYYTPAEIARLGVTRLFSDADRTKSLAEKSDACGGILDPGCGTGQFLLQLPDFYPPHKIRGYDIDPMAVCLARINLCLRYPDEEPTAWTSRIRLGSFLGSENEGINAIIGNPPWGAGYVPAEMQQLADKYHLPGKGKPESAELFVLESLRQLPPGGRLTMVLPESVITVKHCRRFREEILKQCRVDSLVYLGEAFEGVQCPSILVTLEVTGKPMQTAGIKVMHLDPGGLIDQGLRDQRLKDQRLKDQGFRDRRFRDQRLNDQGFRDQGFTARGEIESLGIGSHFYIIKKDRDLSQDRFTLHLSDEEYELAEKCRDPKGKVTLENNARFALGIVTGNNKKMLLDAPEEGAEPVLAGQDIHRYQFDTPTRFLHFTPEQFQQCAREELFRTGEKLIYRFVSRRLVFARDTSGMLTLNSANILIPEHPELSAITVEAVLNSRVAQFLYGKELRSLKVLRTHLEYIPIPLFPEALRNELEELVRKMESAPGETTRRTLYEEIDHIVIQGYRLTEAEQKQLIRSLGEKVDFL